MRPVRLSRIRFIPAEPTLVATGLLGFASAVVNGVLQIDGIAVRRTRDGRLVLSYPARRDGEGREHAYFLPIDERTRRQFERCILRALERQEARRR